MPAPGAALPRELNISRVCAGSALPTPTGGWDQSSRKAPMPLINIDVCHAPSIWEFGAHRRSCPGWSPVPRVPAGRGLWLPVQTWGTPHAGGHRAQGHKAAKGGRRGQMGPPGSGRAPPTCPRCMSPGFFRWSSPKWCSQVAEHDGSGTSQSGHVLANERPGHCGVAVATALSRWGHGAR